MKTHSIKRIPLMAVLLPVFMLCANVSVSHAQSPRLPAAVWSKNAGAVAPALQTPPHFMRDLYFEQRLIDVTAADLENYARSIAVPENITGILFTINSIKPADPAGDDLAVLAAYDNRFTDPVYQDIVKKTSKDLADTLYAIRAKSGIDIGVIRNFLMIPLINARRNEQALYIHSPLVFTKPFDPYITEAKVTTVTTTENRALVLTNPRKRVSPEVHTQALVPEISEGYGRVHQDTDFIPDMTSVPRPTEPAYVGQAAKHPAVRE